MTARFVGIVLLSLLSAACSEPPRWVLWSKVGGEWAALIETDSLNECNGVLAREPVGAGFAYRCLPFGVNP